MKKTIHQFAFILIALSLVLVSTVSCNRQIGQPTDSAEKNTSAPTTNETPADTEPETTWEDVLIAQNAEFVDKYPTLRLLTIDGEFTYNSDSVIGEDKAQYERDMELYDTYGFDIDISHIGIGEIHTAITNMGLNGGVIPHMVIASSSSIMPCAIEGSLQDLNAIDTLRFESGYWVDSYTENCEWNGKIYCTPTYSSRLFYHGPLAIMYNTDIAGQLGITDLYDLVDNGQWTLEKLATYSSMAHTVDSGTGETTQYGLCALSGNGLLMGLYGAIGGTFSTVDQSGNIIVDFSSADVNAKLNKISQLFHAESSHVENWIDDIDSFASGKDLFWYSTTGCFFNGKITGNKDLKYGILPLPKGDPTQDNYITTVNATSNFFTCVIKNWSKQDLRFVGYITELYNYLSWKILRPAKFDILMKYRVAQSGNDLRMIDLIFQTLYFDHNSIYNFGNTVYNMGTAIARNETDAFTSSFNVKYRDLITNDINKYLGL